MDIPWTDTLTCCHHEERREPRRGDSVPLPDDFTGSPRPLTWPRDDVSGRAPTLQHLTSPEKRSIILVLFGTFLEYFDLVLYIHLAVILNPLFFPTNNPVAASLLGVLTFISAYGVRPLGAFVFGWIGDKVGRKASIVWTSLLMGAAALGIGLLPTPASLGFIASFLFIFLRALQGFASIGEITGAQVFLVEVSGKSRYHHFISTLMTATLIFGGLAALAIGTLSLSLDPVSGWRWPFLLGAGVALIGGVIRVRAIESPTFRQVQEKKRHPTSQDAFRLWKLLEWRKRNYWAYFGIELISPLTIYFTMRTCSDLLKDLGLSATQVMTHNFVVNVIYLLSVLFCGWLSVTRDPFTILKRRLASGILLLPLLFMSLALFPSVETIFIVQILLSCLLCGGSTPAQFTIVSSFPIVGRCSNIGSAFAISHALMYAVTALAIFGADQAVGLWGIGVLFGVIALVSLLCASYFETAPTRALSAHREGDELVVE